MGQEHQREVTSQLVTRMAGSGPKSQDGGARRIAKENWFLPPLSGIKWGQAYAGMLGQEHTFQNSGMIWYR